MAKKRWVLCTNCSKAIHTPQEIAARMCEDCRKKTLPGWLH